MHEAVTESSSDLDGRLTQIGRPMPRAATRRLVAGRGRYLDDVSLKGEVHAAFLRCPFAKASFNIIDLSQALAVDGVVRVLTAEDIDAVCTPWTCVSKAMPGMVSPEQRPLAKGHALYQGEPVAMVLARSRAIAEDALELIAVDWQEEPAVALLTEALSPNSPLVHPGLRSNLCWQTEILAGDPDSAFANAALIVSEKLSFERKTGVTLEPRGTLASYDPAANALLVHMSHQMPHQMQHHIAGFLGLSPIDVRVICNDVGGAFGLKMHVYPDEIAVCAASRILGRPVKYVADRIEALAADIHAREHVISGRMALDSGGQILAIEIDDLQGLGAYSVYPRSSVVEALSALRAVGGPYKFEHYRAKLRSALQNKVMVGQYRSVGHPIGCAITERLIDLAAQKRGEDPLDLRRRNFVCDADMPWRSPQGARMIDLSHDHCLERMTSLIDVAQLRGEITKMRTAGRIVGLGFASFLEFTAAGAEAYGRAGVPVAAVDTVVVSADISGELRVQASASEIGQGIQQGLAQIVADAVGVSIDAVRVSLGDTGSAPHGGGAWSSRGAAITGEAAWGAGRKLRDQLLSLAATTLQASASKLDIRCGQIIEAHSGAERMSVAALCRLATFQGYELPAGTAPQLSAVHQWGRETDPTLPTNGIQASLVEIDGETGVIHVLKHWVVEDCGRIINPLLVDEQIRGGVVQGIGEALFEACRYDEAGQLLSGTLADYLVPMAGEMPDIEIAHIETPYSGSTIGAKGAGEAGTCGAPAAILNAVNDALAPFGAQVSVMPITPVAVLRALGTIEAAEMPS